MYWEREYVMPEYGCSHRKDYRYLSFRVYAKYSARQTTQAAAQLIIDRLGCGGT